jgi:hypothetical protein
VSKDLCAEEPLTWGEDEPLVTNIYSGTNSTISNYLGNNVSHTAGNYSVIVTAVTDKIVFPARTRLVWDGEGPEEIAFIWYPLAESLPGGTFPTSKRV